jgi:hypothetical protein
VDIPTLSIHLPNQSTSRSALLDGLNRRAYLIALLVAAAACTGPSTQSSVTGPRKLAVSPETASASAPALSAPAHQVIVPADFWVKYSRRGGQPGTWQVAELAGPECRRQCVVLTPEELRHMYTTFQRHQFDRITTHPIQASPHRGGVCLETRWNGRTHDVCDVTVTEVEARWRQDFDALAEETVEIFLSALARAQPEDAAPE